MQKEKLSITSKPKGKARSSRRNRRRRRNRQFQTKIGPLLSSIVANGGGGGQTTSSATAQSPNSTNTGFELWRETYQNIIRWQTEHQGAFWKTMANKLKRENEELKEKLRRIEEGESSEFSTSDSEEDPVDEKYLKFMEITMKHRETMRLKRETEEESGG